MSKKHIKLPTAELKLPAADLIAADDIIEESAKSLADMIAEAKAKALKEGIKANTVIIDKHFAKVNAFHFAFGRAVMSLPPMICGLEVQVSDELPDGYDFAVLEVPETERGRLIRQAKSEAAREIFEEIESKILERKREARAERARFYLRRSSQAYDERMLQILNSRVNAWIELGRFIAELKKKYTEVQK